MCISTHTTKNIWHIDVIDRQMYNCVWYFCIYLYVLSLNGWHVVFCITNNHHDVTVTTDAIKRHFLIWMTMVRQPTKHRRSCVLTLKYTFLCVYWWTKQRIHNTLIVVDRYLRLMGDKMIPYSAEPRLESFYPPFVAGIDLPHQGVVDSYSLIQWAMRDKCRVSVIDWCHTWHDILSNLSYKFHQYPKLRCSGLVLQLSLPNPLKPGVKSRMKK